MSTSGKTLVTLLNEVDDPRMPSNGTLHDFREILVIAICAVLSDADNVDDFAEWAHVKEDWLRRFLALKNGKTPSSGFSVPSTPNSSRRCSVVGLAALFLR